MSSSLGELRFPLEDRFLARARVSNSRFDEWKAVAQKELHSVLANPRSWYYRPSDLKQAYRPVYEQDAIRGFVKPATGDTDKRELFGLGHFEDLGLEDLPTSYLATTTADHRTVSAQLHGETFLDAAVLRVVEGPHEIDPFHFVGLKWLAFSSPAPAIIPHRDHVYFEFSGTTHDISKRKVLFMYQRTFPMQSGELTEPDKGCTRCTHSQLWLFRTEGGGVLLQGVSSFTPQPDAPSWVPTRVITETFESIKSLAGLPDARAIIDAGVIKSDPPSKGAGENKACVVCLKKFGMMRARIGCRTCGQSVCKLCVVKLSLFNDEAIYTQVPTVLSENFCLGCVRHAKSQRQLETLSAKLSKTAISNIKSDAISTTSSSPFDSSTGRQQTSEGFRFSVGLKVGVTPSASDSGSDAGGSSRSLPANGQCSSSAFNSPASASHLSSARSSRSADLVAAENARIMAFEQMQASIRHQEELLMVMQQERAKMQGHQPVPAAYPNQYAPMTTREDRFQELS
jgi:hypothetical protein